MSKKQFVAAVMGSGGFATCHLTAIRNLEAYYQLPFKVSVDYVVSPTEANREAFKNKFGIKHALHPDDLWDKKGIDALIVAGSNDSHCGTYLKAAESKIPFIYLEKPVCSTEEELGLLENALKKFTHSKVQTGFQFLQMPAVRAAKQKIDNYELGKIIHFHGRYLHGDYLDPAYRQKKSWKLTPAPIGGAMSDLGSHVLSMMIAFFEKTNFKLLSATHSGSFEDTNPQSDLCTTVMFKGSDGSHGTVAASRVSVGSGDLLEFEVWGEKASLKITTSNPDVLEISKASSKEIIYCGNNYKNISTFPSSHVPSGWLRPLTHAHYLFFGAEDKQTFIPNLRHGIDVQILVNEIAKSFK